MLTITFDKADLLDNAHSTKNYTVNSVFSGINTKWSSAGLLLLPVSIPGISSVSEQVDVLIDVQPLKKVNIKIYAAILFMRILSPFKHDKWYVLPPHLLLEMCDSLGDQTVEREQVESRKCMLLQSASI